MQNRLHAGVLIVTGQRFRFTKLQARRRQRILFARFQLGKDLLRLRFGFLQRFVVLQRIGDLRFTSSSVLPFPVYVR